MKPLLTILASLFFVSIGFAEDAMKEIKITKEWKINLNSTVELNAHEQFYKIEFWDKDFVRIDFIMKTNKSDFTANDMQEMLSINANTTSNKLSINTTIDIDKSSSIWNWIVKTKDKLTKSCQYEDRSILYLPKNIAQLNLTINYGDLQIGDINIPLKISSNYSNITIEKNTNKTIISSTYGDVILGNLSNVKINSSYGDFIIDNIDTLNSNTSYCDIKLTTCPFIQSLSTNYGDITIQKVGSIKTTATYSDIKIKSLQQELNSVLTYSDLTIDEIAKTLKAITIVSTYSDNKIKVNPENPINIKIKDVNGDVDIKNSRLQLNISKNESETISDITAKTKSATDASPTIKITSKNSDIIIY
ncbi:MAG TPA: hypothetical protein PK431_04165 [Chitinophagales bacterium]|nr:hypothetical protein [Chitinophagales bacterium]